MRIPAGADIKVNLTIRDNLGNLIDLSASNVIEAKVEVCNEFTRLLFTENPSSDERQLTIVDAANGKVSFVIDRKFTNKWQSKDFDIFATVILDETGNTDYIDGKDYKKGKFKGKLIIEESC